MIIQCDQCKTRFRLDDSRVTATGVKVRCSRCRHTFVVKKESPVECGTTTETDPRPEISSTDAQANDESVGDFGDSRSDIGDNALGVGPGKMDFSVGAFAGMEEPAENDANMPWPRQDGGQSDESELYGERSQMIQEPEPGQVDKQAASNFDMDGDAPEEPELGYTADSPRESRDEETWEMFSTTEFENELETEKQYPAGEEDESAICDETDSGTMPAVEPDPAESIIIGKPGEKLQEEHGTDRFLIFPQAATSGQNADTTATTDEEVPPVSIMPKRKIPLYRAILLAVLFISLAAAGAVYFSGLDLNRLQAVDFSAATNVLTPKGGKIALRNVTGSFFSTPQGERLVVTGEAFTDSPKTPSSIRIMGYVFDNKGDIVMKNPAQLRTSSDIITAMKGTSEIVVSPAKPTPFVVVFKDVPAVAREFGAEVVSSTVLAKK